MLVKKLPAILMQLRKELGIAGVGDSGVELYLGGTTHARTGIVGLTTHDRAGIVGLTTHARTGIVGSTTHQRENS